jgi:hypothetical protein
LKSSVIDSFWQRNKERLLTGTILLLLVYSVIRNSLKAAIRPFWFDELCTWIVARQPNLSALWRSLIRAADGQPPPYYLLERLFDKLISNDEVAFRLPSILAFCLMEWFLFVWLRKRHDSLIAFIAVLLPFLTLLYGKYAVEARPYCIVAACLAAALLAYQRAPAVRWMMIFGVSLVAAQAFHFYSVFMMFPFVAAESIYYLKTKRFRWPVWTAFLAGILPLLVFWPILSSVKAYYSAHVWTHPTLLGMLRTYGWILDIPQGLPTNFSWSLVAGLVLTCAILIACAFLILQAFRADPISQPFFHENLLISGFLLLPLLLFSAIKLTHGALTSRYLLPVTLGMVLLAARGLAYLSRKSLLLVGGLLCISIAMQETAFWLSYYGSYQLGFARQNPAEELVRQAGHPELPVAISEGHDYLELDHYAAPEWRSRLTYVADPESAVIHGKSDSTELDLLVLRDFAPLRVVEYEKFKASCPEFLLYSNPTWENNPDWFVLWLVADGWSTQRVATNGYASVYLVKRNDESH